MYDFPVSRDRKEVERFVALYLDSFERLVGRPLVERRSPDRDLETLFEARFVAVAHGIESDPVFCFGNRAALELWEFSFEEFTRLPSRYSAELEARKERERLLASVRERGFSTSYSGVRASKSGLRFRIENVTVWNVLSPDGTRVGQGATFERFERL